MTPKFKVGDRVKIIQSGESCIIRKVGFMPSSATVKGTVDENNQVVDLNPTTVLGQPVYWMEGVDDKLAYAESSLTEL